MTPASNSIVVNLPSTRTDGSALALSDIASVTVTKVVSGTETPFTQTVRGPFTSTSVSVSDPNPDFGQTDAYTFTVTDVEGNTSAAGTASDEVPPSVLAAPSAPTGTVTFVPAS
jgi:hypothetical protein